MGNLIIRIVNPITHLTAFFKVNTLCKDNEIWMDYDGGSGKIPFLKRKNLILS
jgi:hypothetical protein